MRERVSPFGAPPRCRMLRGMSQAGGVLLSPTGSIDERPPPLFASTPISIRSAMSGATAAVPSRGSEDNLLLHSARSSGLLHSQGSLQEFLKDGGGGGTPESVDKPADASHKMF